MTNSCWIVHKLGLPLSDATKAHFYRQSGSPNRCKTYSEEEFNMMISKKVKVALKVNEKNPKKDNDVESINMEEFNYDPTSD